MPVHKNKKPLLDNGARVKIILIVILLCLAFLLLNNNGLINLYKAKQENTALIQQKELLEAKEKNLVDETEKLQTDKKHIEKTAREQYNMVKPGEKVYKVIEEK